MNFRQLLQRKSYSLLQLVLGCYGLLSNYTASHLEHICMQSLMCYDTASTNTPLCNECSLMNGRCVVWRTQGFQTWDRSPEMTACVEQVNCANVTSSDNLCCQQSEKCPLHLFGLAPYRQIGNEYITSLCFEGRRAAKTVRNQRIKQISLLMDL